MPYFVVDKFPGGLDVRDAEFAAPAGCATVAENAHLTRANRWEKRKAFVSKYVLPAGQTFGLAAIKGLNYVFGYLPAPAMPTGVLYQRLVHPDSAALTRILSVDPFNGKLYVVAQFSDGSIYHYYDGNIVAAWVDGRARASFTINAGSTGGIASVKVDGVEVLNVAVAWATSHTATAVAVAAQINLFASAPEYTAVNDGATVYIIAAAAEGVDPNGRVVTVAVSGTVTVTNVANMDGGSAIAGTYSPGPFARTFKEKMYSVADSLVVFSGVGDPTVLNSDSTNSPGAGAVNLSNHAAGSEELKGIGLYLSFLAFFAKEAIQVWAVDADDLNNALAQSIPKHGTDSPRSIIQFNETDLFYLDRSRGIRALRPSGTVANYAVIDDVGSAIDPLIRTRRKALSADTVSRAMSLIEPVDGRYWLSMGDRIYVYTYFPKFKVFGWSEYVPGFTVDDIVTNGEQILVRSGNTIYEYGGDDGDTYDDCVARVRLPSIVASAPASFKNLIGIDVGVEGLWEVTMYHNPNDSTGEPLLIVDQMTYDQPGNPVAGDPTHPVLEFVSQGSGYARISNLALHFNKHDQE